MKTKQASIYLRVLWLNDNENLRPSSLNIKLDGETTEDVIFSISQNDNNIGNNSLWENVTEWANGITYNYQKIIENEDNSQLQEENSPKTEEINEIKENNIPYVIPSVINIPNNYRCNILKNAETETYSYYTIKMTYVPPKRKLMARSSTPILNFNGTTIENINFNDAEIQKVVFNGVTVFEKQLGAPLKDAILANSTLNEGTPDFSLRATTDEGMFETDDPIYGEGAKSQYFRGAVLNNYVKFAGFWWRIIRINGDGTVRLIYDGTSGHVNGIGNIKSIAIPNIQYSTVNGKSNYVGWTYEEELQRPSDSNNAVSCNAKIQLESWFSDNIPDIYLNKVDTSAKFCNDRRTGLPYSGWSGYVTEWSINGTKFSYAGVDRVLNKKQPTLNCLPKDVYTLNVGLITADEAEFAGGNGDTNSSYYLYIKYNYITMTPSYYSSSISWMHGIDESGSISLSYKTMSKYNIRPVINLKADVQVTGTGTMEDPYVVVGAE